jgi:hypothetical protein
MGLMSRDALLGASDLTEREIELPTIGGSVRVRSLPAAYSNQATSEALEMVTGARGEQTAHVNTGKLEALQVLHGLVEPRLHSIEEAYTFATRCGPAWRAVVDTIDAISGIDKAAIEKTNATFRPSGPGAPGPDVEADAANGSGGPDLHLHAGAGAAHAGG